MFYYYYFTAYFINILTTDILIILYRYIYFMYLFYLSSHDIVQQFHQDYFELLDDGAPNAPKHVGAKSYTDIWLFECILFVFHSPYENA
jgi:hypothetical protein